MNDNNGDYNNYVDSDTADDDDNGNGNNTIQYNLQEIFITTWHIYKKTKPLLVPSPLLHKTK